MAIDDNTIYGLYGSQIKDLPEKINAVKGKAKVLTAADYNYPATGTKTAVALWLLPAGVYYTSEGVTVKPTTGSGYVSAGDIYIVASPTANATGSIVRLTPNNSSAQYYSFVTAVGGGTMSFLTTSVVNNLTSTSTTSALSANQGKVLKDLIDSIAIRGAGAPTTSTVGQVGTLYEDTTNGDLYICTDATNPYVWEEVGAGGSGPTVVQTTGTSTTDVMSQNATTSMVFANPSSKTQVQIGNGANAAANTGNATIAIGNNAKAYQPGSDESSSIYTMAVGVEAVAKGNRSLALGANSSAAYTGSVAVGAGANTTSVGQFDIGTRYDSYGYNSSNYRLLTGVYDPQTAHDAATKGYVDNSLLGKQDALTAGDGITIEDESGSLVISATSSGPTVVQTTGSSTTDVMSQNAVTNALASAGPTVVQDTGSSETAVMSQKATTRMIYNGGNSTRVQIGANSGSPQNWSVAILGVTSQENTIAIGNAANATAKGAIALGMGASASTQGVFDVGLSGAGSSAQSNNGYNGSAYRLLTGLYDPQSAHDAATKGYVDTAVAGGGVSVFTTNEWNALWA